MHPRQGECSQRSYVREELLTEQVDEILSRIELGPELDGAVPVDSYRDKVEELVSERRALELQLSELDDPSTSTAALVAARAGKASRARIVFNNADESGEA